MDPQFWRQRWQSNEIGWHEGQTNAMLAKHWPSLGRPAGARVFVPLCGKSRDMAWLASQGHPVMGAELSEIAVREFFAESGLEPRRESRDGFEISSAGGIEIWRGDLFDLQPRHLADIVAVYDRASLVAMPPSMQPRYAEQMAQLVPKGVPILLVTFDTGETERKGPPFSTSPEHVRTLYDGSFEITELESSRTDKISPNLTARGVREVEQNVLVLRRR